MNFQRTNLKRKFDENPNGIPLDWHVPESAHQNRSDSQGECGGEPARAPSKDPPRPAPNTGNTMVLLREKLRRIQQPEGQDDGDPGGPTGFRGDGAGTVTEEERNGHGGAQEVEKEEKRDVGWTVPRGRKRQLMDRQGDHRYDLKRPRVEPSTPLRTRRDALSDYIQDQYECRRQTKELYADKMRLRDALYAVAKTLFPYCGLYVIGSSMNGFGSNSSDMDLCLMLSQNEIDQRKEATGILRILQRDLSKHSFLYDIRLIQAKVPILKFTDAVSQVECDLNINNSVGIRNTHLLNCYSSLDWRVPPLVLAVKSWAKFKDINDASHGTLSSYSLVLMIIHYLQQGCTPPVLPSLQQKYPHKFDPSIDVRSLSLSEKLAPYSSPNRQSLAELFVGFIDYYANRFRFQHDAVSVRLGRTISRSLVPSGLLKYICIEEPFNLTNTAYSVFDRGNFELITQAFRDCHALLAAPSLDPRDVLPPLRSDASTEWSNPARPATLRVTEVGPMAPGATATVLAGATAGRLVAPHVLRSVLTRRL